MRWVACRKLGHHGVKSRLLGATVLVPAIGCHGIGVEDDAIWHAGRWARRVATDEPHPCVAGDAGWTPVVARARHGVAVALGPGCKVSSAGRMGPAGERFLAMGPPDGPAPPAGPSFGRVPHQIGGCPRARKCRRSRSTACLGAGCRARLNDRPHVQQASIQRRPSATSRLA